MKIKEKIEQGWLHCIIIIEIAGRPADYIKKAMELVLKGISKEKDVEIIGKNVHKPKEVDIFKQKPKLKNAKKLFSTFAEVELLVKGFGRLMGFVFDFMPSSIEIIEPLYLRLELNDANNIVNDLATRLHNYDASLKRFSMENEILKKQLEELKSKR